MANVRTLKLNLLADTTDFANGIKKASGQTNSFAKDIARNMKIATAAAGGLAVAFGVSAVKAAIDDQKAQKQLQIALKNTTKATDKQIGKVEDWISAQGRLLGVTDDELRPALAKLVRVTGDVNKSQDLLNLAMDIAAGTGKNLSSVTDALVRAQNGNLGALKKLGVPLSDATVKNKDLAKALQEADKRFHGAAKAAGDTMAGKLKKFKTAMDESKESIGYAILQGLQPFAEKWLPKVTTGVQHFIDGLTGQNNNGGLKGAMKDSQTSLYNLGQDIKGFFKFLTDHEDVLKRIGTAMAAIFIGAKAGAATKLMVTALQSLLLPFAEVTTAAGTAAAAEAAATGGASLWAAAPAIVGIATALGIAGLSGMWAWHSPTETSAQKSMRERTGVAVVGSSDPAVAQRWQDLHEPASAQGQHGMIWFNGKLQFDRPYMHSVKNQPLVGLRTQKAGVPLTGYPATGAPRNFRQSQPVIINMNGVVDGDSARRSIERVIQQSTIRSGKVNFEGSAL